MATFPAIQPLRVPDPLQGYATVQNILASRQQQQLNTLALDKARLEAEREKGLTSYLTSADLATPAGRAGLLRFGEPGLRYQTALGQAQTAQIAQARAQSELISSRLAQSRQLFAMAPTPDALAAAATSQFNDPVLGPVLQRLNLTPESLATYIAQKSATPQGFAQVKLEFASTADQLVDQLKAEVERGQVAAAMAGEEAPGAATAAPGAAAAPVTPAQTPRIPLAQRPPMTPEAEFLQMVSADLTRRGFSPERAREELIARGPALQGPSTVTTALPVGQYAGQAVEAPSAEGVAEGMGSFNALASEAPEMANALAAVSQAPAAQAAPPTAPTTVAPATPTRPAAGRPDVTQLEADRDKFQRQYDSLMRRGLAKQAADLYTNRIKPIEDRIERATKDNRTELVRNLAEFGLPPTLEGVAALEAAKRDPSSVGMREYSFAVQQGFKGSFFDYKKALAEANRSTVQVKLPAQEGAFETELGKGQAKRILDSQVVAQDAVGIIDTVQQGRKLLQSGMITGFGAEVLTKFGSALNQIGISFAADAVANTQAFAANMGQNVGRLIKQFGAGTGLSDADREYAEKMAGGKITIDKAALEKILDINERAARNVIATHNKSVQGIKTNIPLTVELPAAVPAAPGTAPPGRPSLQQIFQQPAGR